MRYTLLIVLTGLFACAEPPDRSPPLPPGFTDAPPAGPTAPTQVLSGGILVAAELAADVEDAAVVITDGRLVAWGKRGEVEMPNQSIGHDLRGKWLAPGRRGEPFNPNSPLMPDQPAALLIFDQPPRPGLSPIGYVEAEVISLPPSD